MTPVEAVEFWADVYSNFPVADVMPPTDIVLWSDETYLKSQEQESSTAYYTPVQLKIENGDVVNSVMLADPVRDQVHLISSPGHGRSVKAFFVTSDIGARELGVVAILIQESVPLFIFSDRYATEFHIVCISRDELKFLLEILASMLDFLARPFVDTETHQTANRQQRRALERKGQIAPMVRTVTLRKALPSGSPGHVDREYSCQWEVSGHWRQTKHRLVYVRPHIKGPEGKPLKPKLPTVYVAAR